MPSRGFAGRHVVTRLSAHLAWKPPRRLSFSRDGECCSSTRPAPQPTVRDSASSHFANIVTKRFAILGRRILPGRRTVPFFHEFSWAPLDSMFLVHYITCPWLQGGARFASAILCAPFSFAPMRWPRDAGIAGRLPFSRHRPIIGGRCPHYPLLIVDNVNLEDRRNLYCARRIG